MTEAELLEATWVRRSCDFAESRAVRLPRPCAMSASSVCSVCYVCSPACVRACVCVSCLFALFVPRARVLEATWVRRSCNFAESRAVRLPRPFAMSASSVCHVGWLCLLCLCGRGNVGAPEPQLLRAPPSSVCYVCLVCLLCLSRLFAISVCYGCFPSCVRACGSLPCLLAVSVCRCYVSWARCAGRCGGHATQRSTPPPAL